jgi:hypothetical chaperone protein
VRIAIDFGTTNSSAGFFDGDEVHLIPLEGESTVMPSMIYITREGEHYVGNEAIRLYLEQNTGRPAVYRRFDIGSITETYSWGEWGPLIVIRRVYCLHDIGAPGRLFQSVKIGLRDPNFTGTRVFDRFYRLEELIAIVLRYIKRKAEDYLGDKIDSVVLGRPVSYVHKDLEEETRIGMIEQTAVAKMIRAAQIAGFRDVGLVLEPVAAAHYYQLSINERATVLVFDFGGGTLDLAILRLHPDGLSEVIAVKGVLVGGDDFDSRIMTGKLLKYFGAGSTFGPKRLPFPSAMLEYLAKWQTIPALSQPPYREQIREIKRESSNPEAIEALECLASKNYGFQLFREIEHRKKVISKERHTFIMMNAEDIHIREPLHRIEFESLINDFIIEIDQGIKQCIANSGLENDDIDKVIMTGGSSLIPCIVDLLARRFGRDKIQFSSPFTSIVSGLAVIAAKRHFLGAVKQTPEFLEAVDSELGIPLTEIAKSGIVVGDKVSFCIGQQEIVGTVITISNPTGTNALLTIEYWLYVNFCEAAADIEAVKEFNSNILGVFTKSDEEPEYFDELAGNMVTTMRYEKDVVKLESGIKPSGG